MYGVLLRENRRGAVIGSFVGAMFVAGASDPDGLTKWIGFVAMILAAANVVGGYVVTDRMLEMFKARPAPPKQVDGDRGPRA